MLKPSQDAVQWLRLFADNVRYPRNIVQMNNRHARVGEWHVARNRDDTTVVRMKSRLADLRPEYLQLRMIAPLEPFDNCKIARRQAAQQFGESSLGSAREFVHLNPAPRRRHDDFSSTGFPMLVGILSRQIDVEGMVRVLDGRHT